MGKYTIRDRTNEDSMTAQEKNTGWEFVECPTCYGTGSRDGVCGLCEGKGKIKALK